MPISLGLIRDTHGAHSRSDDDSELLSQEGGPATATEGNNLGLHFGALVLRTRRLRRRHGKPFMYEEACLAVSRFPGPLRTCEVGNYSILALAQRHGIDLGRASEKLKLAPALPPVAELLQVEPTGALLQLDRLIFCRQGSVIEWRKGLCRLEPQSPLAELN
jgi:GntR family transcriptional regulator